MRKNLLLFTSTFPRCAGDPEVPLFVFELGRELTRYFNVHVLAPHAPGASEHEVMDGMQVSRFPYFAPTAAQSLAYGAGILANLKARPFAWLQVAPFFFMQWRALRRVVRRHRIDVVNSHWMLPQGLVASFLPPRSGPRQVLTIHAAGLFALRRLPAGRALARRIVARSDLIYAVSGYNQQVLEELVGRSVTCRILPMGIHTGYYDETVDREEIRKQLRWPAGKIILYVGKLNEKKGVTYLLQAFHQLQDKLPETRLVVVGTGILEDRLKQEAEHLGIASRVVFAGPLDKAMVKRCFQASDLVVVPSIVDSRGETEGLPVVLLEALACGKPVVATRVGGAPDVLQDGENGFLVDPGDSAALAMKIRQALLCAPEDLPQRARRTAQQFDWRIIGQDYRDRILSLFESSPPV